MRHYKKSVPAPWCNRYRKNGTLDLTSFNHRLKRHEKDRSFSYYHSAVDFEQFSQKKTVRRDNLIVHLFLTPAFARPFQNDPECVF